jgi:hypothetical protein
MPVNCAAAISRTGMQVLPFDPIPGKVADVFPYPEGCEAILRALGAGKGRGLQDLKNATAPLWPKDAAPQKDMMVYEILRALHASGRIRFEDSEVPGRDGTTASRKRACPRN